jgi:curved DNA-binding protein CbpA
MSYYSLLGVSPTASSKEILAGYQKEQSRILTASIKGDVGTQMLVNLDEALSTLSNPVTRQSYDLRLSESGAIVPGKSINYGEKLFNFAKHRQTNKISWRELVSSSGESGQVLSSLFTKTLYLPNQDLQQKFITAALLTPSAIAETLPFLFMFGMEGSGKSLTCKIAAKVWGTTCLGAGSTAVALRNNIKESKWGIYEGVTYERNCGISFNDVTLNTFRKNEMLIPFFKAYNREESKLQISSPEKDGSNLTYDIFANKIASSIWPLFAMEEFKEMARRMLTFYCEKAPKGIDLIPLSDIDLFGLDNLMNDTWANDKICEQFSKMNLRKAFSEADLDINIDRFDTVKDVLKAGIVTGVWNDAKEAISDFGKLELFQNELRLSYGDKLKLILKEYMRGCLENCLALSRPQRVTPLEIKNYLNTCWQQGKLDSNPKPREVDNLLRSFGYSYDNKHHFWS